MREVAHPYSLLQHFHMSTKRLSTRSSLVTALYVPFKVVRIGQHCGFSACSAFPTKFWQKDVIDITVSFRVLCYLKANPMFMLDRANR